MELGFLASQLSGSNEQCLLGGCRLDYIALGVQREPLDQTDLCNGVDASSKAV